MQKIKLKIYKINQFDHLKYVESTRTYKMA